MDALGASPKRTQAILGRADPLDGGKRDILRCMALPLLGFGLIIWPFLGVGFDTPARMDLDISDALDVIGGTFTTLGFGDITPIGFAMDAAHGAPARLPRAARPARALAHAAPRPRGPAVAAWCDAPKRTIRRERIRRRVPKLEAIDRRAVLRAARGLAPMLKRRVGYLGRGDAVERSVRALIEARLDAIEDDDLFPPDAEEVLWARVERSGLVLVGIGERAYIVARAAPRGGRAARLLVP